MNAERREKEKGKQSENSSDTNHIIISKRKPSITCESIDDKEERREREKKKSITCGSLSYTSFFSHDGRRCPVSIRLKETETERAFSNLLSHPAVLEPSDRPPASCCLVLRPTRVNKPRNISGSRRRLT